MSFKDYRIPLFGNILVITIPDVIHDTTSYYPGIAIGLEDDGKIKVHVFELKQVFIAQQRHLKSSEDEILWHRVGD